MALRKDPVDPFHTFENQIRKNHLTRDKEDSLRKQTRREIEEQTRIERETNNQKFSPKNYKGGRSKLQSTITTNPYSSRHKNEELQRLIIERAKQLK